MNAVDSDVMNHSSPSIIYDRDAGAQNGLYQMLVDPIVEDREDEDSTAYDSLLPSVERVSATWILFQGGARVGWTTMV